MKADELRADQIFDGYDVAVNVHGSKPGLEMLRDAIDQAIRQNAPCGVSVQSGHVLLRVRHEVVVP